MSLMSSVTSKECSLKNFGIHYLSMDMTVNVGPLELERGFAPNVANFIRKKPAHHDIVELLQKVGKAKPIDASA